MPQLKTINISEKLHTGAKIEASRAGLSIQDWLNSLIRREIDRLEKERKGRTI